MKIPFLDLDLQYQKLKPEIQHAIFDVLKEKRFVRGSWVGRFEKKFSTLLKSKNCIGTNSGTDSLFLSLKALGVGYGDEVITPAFSWISSAQTISLCGARPVFIDVDPQTFTIEPALIEEKITKNTRAVIVVHLYGQAAHISDIRKICRKHNLYLIEDCAQAHLSREGKQYAGTFGDAGAFSFYPTKNLGAYGDAGCIITGDNKLAERIRRLCNHGALQKEDHLIEGHNSRMDTMQAAILTVKLGYLKSWNEKRRHNAGLYYTRLEKIREIHLPFVRPNTNHSFHLFVIRCKKRNELQEYLRRRGIQTIVHYPRALHNLPAYKHQRLKATDFPIANKLQDEVLSLPIYPELNESQIHYVCSNIERFFTHR